MRLVVFGNSYSVPGAHYTHFSAWQLWLEFATFWVNHPAWQRAYLTDDLYHASLAARLRPHQRVRLDVWARPWWTLQDYLDVLPRVDVSQAAVIVQCGLPEVRPNHFSRIERTCINLTPRWAQRRFTSLELRHARRGTLRFNGGWFGWRGVRARLDALLEQLERRGAAQVIVLTDECVSDTIEGLLPGLRQRLHEFATLASDSAAAHQRPLLNVTEPLRSDPAAYAADGVHWSPRGHHLVADALLPFVVGG